MYIAIPFLKQQIAAVAPHKHTLSPHFAGKNAVFGRTPHRQLFSLSAGLRCAHVARSHMVHVVVAIFWRKEGWCVVVLRIYHYA